MNRQDARDAKREEGGIRLRATLETLALRVKFDEPRFIRPRLDRYSASYTFV
jgi:hypothetical protein